MPNCSALRWPSWPTSCPSRSICARSSVCTWSSRVSMTSFLAASSCWPAARWAPSCSCWRSPAWSISSRWWAVTCSSCWRWSTAACCRAAWTAASRSATACSCTAATAAATEAVTALDELRLAGRAVRGRRPPQHHERAAATRARRRARGRRARGRRSRRCSGSGCGGRCHVGHVREEVLHRARMPSTPRARSWLVLLVAGAGITVGGLAACGGGSGNDRAAKVDADRARGHRVPGRGGARRHGAPRGPRRRRHAHRHGHGRLRSDRSGPRARVGPGPLRLAVVRAPPRRPGRHRRALRPAGARVEQRRQGRGRTPARGPRGRRRRGPRRTGPSASSWSAPRSVPPPRSWPQVASTHRWTRSWPCRRPAGWVR